MADAPRIGVTNWSDVAPEALDRYWARVREAGGEVVDLAEASAGRTAELAPSLDDHVLVEIRARKRDAAAPRPRLAVVGRHIHPTVVGDQDAVPVERVKEYQLKLQDYLQTRKGGLLQTIREKKEVDKDLEAQMKTALDEFKTGWR